MTNLEQSIREGDVLATDNSLSRAKECPFCGKPPQETNDSAVCRTPDCALEDCGYLFDEWNTRAIEHSRVDVEALRESRDFWKNCAGTNLDLVNAVTEKMQTELDKLREANRVLVEAAKVEMEMFNRYVAAHIAGECYPSFQEMQTTGAALVEALALANQTTGEKCITCGESTQGNDKFCCYECGAKGGK